MGSMEEKYLRDSDGLSITTVRQLFYEANPSTKNDIRTAYTLSSLKDEEIINLIAREVRRLHRELFTAMLAIRRLNKENEKKAQLKLI